MLVGLHVRVHVLRLCMDAFIHTNEQQVWFIYRVAIIVHCMCQLLLSKYPDITSNSSKSQNVKVGRKKNQSVCVCVQGAGIFDV